MNFNDGEHKVFHPLTSMNLKYSWPINQNILNQNISWAAGFGLYLDMPPATSKYHGSAGFQFPISLHMDIGQDYKLFFELAPRLGYYRDSENIPRSSFFDNRYKMSLGINIGYLFKVGRI